jgi:hypothetical protein
MKLVPSLFAFAFASLLAATSAFAETAPAAPAKPAKAPCGCAVAADGKVCGKDKDCCCTGEKAKPAAPAEKKSCCVDGKCTDSAKCETKTDGKACAPCTACK